jgi:hypothetical protein
MQIIRIVFMNVAVCLYRFCLEQLTISLRLFCVFTDNEMSPGISSYSNLYAYCVS